MRIISQPQDKPVVSKSVTIPPTVGEVITHVNDQPVHTPKEFYREAAKAGTAKPLELTLFRWDGRLTPRVTLP